MSHVQEKVTKAYEKAGGKMVGAIPWDLLFSFLKDMLANCGAKDVKAMAKNHPVYVKGVLTRRLVSDEGMIRKEAALVAGAAVEAINKSSAGELMEVE